MGKKKKSKKRGSREHGRGRKKGRGAGIRGGRGNAGADAHRRSKIYKEHGRDYFGSDGFNRPPKVVDEDVTVNVDDLARLADELQAEGHADPDGDAIEVDLDAAGIDKLLGAGRVHRSFRVRVGDATDKALEKIQAQGGEVTVLGSEDEGADDNGEASGDEPSNP